MSFFRFYNDVVFGKIGGVTRDILKRICNTTDCFKDFFDVE